MTDVLAGTKGWFIWTGSHYGRNGLEDIARLTAETGCTALAVKTFDGPDAFTQPWTLRDLREACSDIPGITIGAWGYHYGHDVEGELHHVDLALDRLGADFVILNVEDPALERNPRTPRLWSDGLARLRERQPDAGLYFCSHAQPAYHERQPYWQATEQGLIHQPMIYHTAMERDPVESVHLSMSQYDRYGLIPRDDLGQRMAWSAAGGAYDSGNFHVEVPDLVAWAETAIAEGATSTIYWSLDWARRVQRALDAVSAAPSPPGKEKDRNCE